MNKNIKLEIGDFLGFCDMNGLDALDNERIENLENYINACNDGMINGEPIVEDAIYDRLMEILRKVNPSSDLANRIWEDYEGELDDSDVIFRNNPMYSIMTVKSYDCDEIKKFIERLPDNTPFDAHISVKLNGHGIRLKYKNGEFIQARSRARSSAGRDITKQLSTILGNRLTHIPAIEGFDICEIRGEWVLPLDNLSIARQYNSTIKSAFSGVSSMGRDSASMNEWSLLRFVAYEFIADDFSFDTKEKEYTFLEELGFTIPLYIVVENLTKETLISELPNIVSDCEEWVEPTENNRIAYEFYTDGLVFSMNDNDFFKCLGDDGSHYKFGNMALKIGYWKQDMYCGYIQTIMWMKGKTKVTPVAIIADTPDIIEFNDLYTDGMYVFDKKEIKNYNNLGVVTASGNKVRRVPLYEPNNMVILDAYKGNLIYFRYGGEAGVVPCFDDGTLLADNKVKSLVGTDDIDIYDGTEEFDFYDEFDE